MSKQEPRTCPGCGESMRGIRTAQVHCSRECKDAQRRASIDSAYTVDEISGCWLWMRGADKTGRGQTTRTVDGKARLLVAPRYFYERANGRIPEDHEIHHRCETPSCVNPAHLEALTPLEHAARHGRIPEELRNEIRRRVAAGETQAAAARAVGVSRTSAGRIVRAAG